MFYSLQCFLVHKGVRRVAMSVLRPLNGKVEAGSSSYSLASRFCRFYRATAHFTFNLSLADSQILKFSLQEILNCSNGDTALGLLVRFARYS